MPKIPMEPADFAGFCRHFAIFTTKFNFQLPTSSSWWFQPPHFEKYARQNGNLPQIGMKWDEHKKNI